MFTPGFTSPTLLEGYPTTPLQDYHLLRSGFRAGSRRYGFVRFRSPLLTESRLISFPAGTEMFQFSAFASQPYAFRLR